ncbi:MAG: hypothetical protein QM535_22200 [Limnohabitans sp.]|nr:hypothetical protein [Limnohabitans sp.]
MDKKVYSKKGRNKCAYNKDVEPIKEQVEELIESVNWVIKNVF